MTGGLFRGTPGDNIRATPAGITENAFGSTSGGLPEINVETPLDGAIPSTREHIEGHLSSLRSLLKEHNGRGNVSPTRLSFDDTEDQPRVQTVVTGKVGDADLKKPFKEAVKTPLTRRIIEFAGPEFKMPTNIKLYDGTTDRKIILVSEEAFASTELPKGEASKASKKSMGLTSRSTKRTKIRARNAPDSISARSLSYPRKISYGISAKPTATQADATPTKKIEMALESGKLNHLIKDVRQRGRGNAKGRDAGKDKIIYMIRSWLDDKKIKSVKRDKSWIKVPIVFPPLSVEDVSNEPLVIEAVMEGYLVRRVYVDQGASLEDRLESPPSSVLNDTLHDKVSHSERYHNPGHANCNHCRMPEAGKEANDQKGSQLKNSPRRGRSENSRFNKIDVNQPGVPRSAGYDMGKPVRRMTQVVIKEVEEWVNTGIIPPVKYPTWIANPALVKKADGSWRMCIDFKNLNSVCPKDYYPLPDIDGKIDSIVGATYQRLVDTAFQSQIGRNLEAYVDDMVIKSNDEKMMIVDIAETVEEGKFLGYMVTSEGIRANPKKTKAIADMQSPRTLKEMQSLSEKLAALKRFLSHSAVRSLPFFETLKDITKENKDEYSWTESAEKAFQEMKQCIVGLPLLTTPVKEETLTLNEAERNYVPMEKLALSLLHMSRRLRRYFEAHPIKVITDQQLKQGSEASLVLIIPSSMEFTYALRLNFMSTNNEAEYEALLAGLRMAKKMNVQYILANVDSKPSSKSDQWELHGK
ncbi:reverse transcriptase domain-containing protein [Tanacetum coccineum]